MKIADIKVYIMSKPLGNEFAFSQGWVNKRSSVIIEIISDEGVSGWGECMCHGLQDPSLSASVIEFCYKQRLIGREITDIDVIWEELYNLARPYGKGGVTTNALSGIDTALWDCFARSMQMPVYKLLGGAYRKKVLAYATGFYRTRSGKYPDDAVVEAKNHVKKGFKGFKLKIGFGVKKDIEYIKAVRAAVGHEVLIMADANGAYNAGAARSLMLEIRDERLFFMEEPLPPEDIDGYCTLRNLTATRVAAGECILSKQELRRWLQAGALDIIQPDLCSAGGFTECRKMSALCQAWNTLMIPHVWGSGIGLAASLQFIASIPPSPLCLEPEEPMLEFDQSDHPFRSALIFNSINLGADGYVSIPDKPGIGIEVNRDIIAEYARKINIT